MIPQIISEEKTVRAKRRSQIVDLSLLSDESKLLLAMRLLDELADKAEQRHLVEQAVAEAERCLERFS